MKSQLEFYDFHGKGGTRWEDTLLPKIPASGAGGANGVMLDSSLSVKKTVTATGVKAPTITGGSSGGGGGGTASTPKIAINGLKNPIGEIQMNVGDLKDETEAKKSLPSMVTLLVDNKKIKDVTAKTKMVPSMEIPRAAIPLSGR